MEYSKPGLMFLNGTPLVEVTQARMRNQSNDKPVKTLAKGMSGHSDGAEEVMVDFENAIPLSGFEADFNTITRTHRTVRIAFRIGSIQYEMSGRFVESDTSTSVDNANGINVSFSGKILASASVG